MKHVNTKHAQVRIRQRGLKENDVAMILEYGTLTKKGPMITRKDYSALEHNYKKKLSCLRRLVGKIAMTDGSVVITVFHATKAQQKRLLR